MPRSSFPSFLVLGVLLFGMGGCSTSPWGDAFVAAPGTPAIKLDAQAEVRVRQVPWDRLQAGLREIEAQAAASNVHPDEWSPERKAEVKAKMLRTLQVSENPSTVTILGRSSFRTTRPPRPLQGGVPEGIAEQARRVGATGVAWSFRHVGKAETIVQEPVWTYSTGLHDHYGRAGYGAYGSSSTVWVPVVILADQYAFVAYFMRPAE